MQPRVHSRATHASCGQLLQGLFKTGGQRGIMYLGFLTGIERVDSGSTTRRATVHFLWSGLKIESPKTREGPRVIIFRPWLENRGGSDSTAKVQLQETTRTKPVQKRIALNDRAIDHSASCGVCQMGGLCASTHHVWIEGREPAHRARDIEATAFSVRSVCIEVCARF